MPTAYLGRIVLDTKQLDQIAKNLNTNADAALGKLAKRVEGEAKKIVPVDTHALQNSLIAEPLGHLHWWVHDQTEYGIYVELGHLTRPFRKSSGCQRFIAARPFLTPAMEIVAKYVGAEFKKDLFVW